MRQHRQHARTQTRKHIHTHTHTRARAHTLTHIHTHHQLLDSDRGGTLSFDELREGLRKMPFEQAIAVTAEDWERMTRHGARCGSDGTVSFSAFEEMVREELERHIEEKVTHPSTV